MFIGEMSLLSPCNIRFAMTTLAASLGWKVSQKMYLDRSSQTFETPVQVTNPPYRPA